MDPRNLMVIMKAFMQTRFGGLAYTEHDKYDSEDHLFKTIVEFVEQNINVKTVPGKPKIINDESLIAYLFYVLS